MGHYIYNEAATSPRLVLKIHRQGSVLLVILIRNPPESQVWDKNFGLRLNHYKAELGEASELCDKRIARCSLSSLSYVVQKKFRSCKITNFAMLK